MHKVSRTLLLILGSLLIALAVLTIAFGTWYGISETNAFYARISEYYALDDERTALQAQLDSLYSICYAAEELGELEQLGKLGKLGKLEPLEENLPPCPVQNEIDSIEQSAYYADLLGTPPPPMGFSLAGLISVFAFLIAIIPLGIGIIIIIITAQRK